MYSWRNMAFNELDLNIGVVGSPGVGKSTFINTVRRLKPTDQGAAPTGVVQTTMEPTSYEHPQNPHVKFWDLPGFGTPYISTEKFSEAIQSMNYELFIIIGCSRFTEYDLRFAQEMQKAKKHFYFARTKVDIDIYNYKQDYPQTPSTTVLQKLKSDCIANLPTINAQKVPVFLICKNPLVYDFFRLEEEIINDLPERMRQALLLTLRSISPKIIRDKALLLKGCSLLTGENSPLAGTESSHHLQSIQVDTRNIWSEINFYKKVFGLDDEGLKQLSRSASVPEQILVDANKENFWYNVSEDSLLKAIEYWNASGDVDNGTQHAKNAPADDSKNTQIITKDCIVSELPSFAKMHDFLRHLIDTMEMAMLDVITAARKFQQ